MGVPKIFNVFGGKMKWVLVFYFLSSSCYSACLWPLEKYHYIAKIYGLKVGDNYSYWQKMSPGRFRFNSLIQAKIMSKNIRIKYESDFEINKNQFLQTYSKSDSTEPGKSFKKKHTAGEFGFTVMVPLLRYLLLTGRPLRKSYLFEIGGKSVPVFLKVGPEKTYSSPYLGKILVLEVLYSANNGGKGKVYYAVKRHYLPVLIKSKSPEYYMLPSLVQLNKLSLTGGCVLR
jgi:hypothetical protein